MAYLLQEKFVVYKDKTGLLCCFELSFDSPFFETSVEFIKKTIYKKLTSDIKQIIDNSKTRGEKALLVVSSDYYNLAGFIPFLDEITGPQITITSTLGYMINYLSLSAGIYNIVDLYCRSATVYKISIADSSYSLLSVTPCADSIAGLLEEKFKPFLIDEFSPGKLFNYRHINEVNSFIESGAVEERDLEYLTVPGAISSMLTIDLFEFFNIIGSAIREFVQQVQSSEDIIINSPLLSFYRVKEFVKSGRMNLVNLLNGFNEPVNLSVYKNYGGLRELASYPAASQLVISKRAWMLTEIDNLLLQFTQYTGLGPLTQTIDMGALREPFGQTTFLSGSRTLVKFLLEYQDDDYNNTELKIRTLDNLEYFHLINSSC